jgi:protein-S-isoprenylcysteine O-methyltransferase Ste14
MSIGQKVRVVLLRISGYLIPIVQQLPSLGIYVGLMTVPVFVYLVLLFLQFPASFMAVVPEFLQIGSLATPGIGFTYIVIVVGLVLVLYAAIYLRLHKRDGLVVTGPYRYIRHPQYTGLLLFTLGLTTWSYWLLSVTRGIGWLTREWTISLWYAELFAYIVLAVIEESYLSKAFNGDYNVYKRRVPFLLPLGKASRYDLPLTLLIFSLVLIGLIHLELPTLPIMQVLIQFYQGIRPFTSLSLIVLLCLLVYYFWYRQSHSSIRNQQHSS